MSKREGRKWVRQHWAEFMRNADLPDDPFIPESAIDVWSDECLKLADRIDIKEQ